MSQRMGNPLGQHLRKHTTQLLAEGFSATNARDKEPPVPASPPHGANPAWRVMCDGAGETKFTLSRTSNKSTRVSAWIYLKCMHAHVGAEQDTQGS